MALIGDGVLRFGEARAQPMVGQPRDEEAEPHEHAERDDAFRRCDEDGRSQKPQIVPEAKAAFDAALRFLRRHEFVSREDGGLQDRGCHQEAGLPPHVVLDLRLRDHHRCLEVPRHDGTRVLAWASTPHVMLRMGERALHLEPGRESFPFALACRFCIGLTGTALVRPVPPLEATAVFSLLPRSLACGPGPCFSLLRPHRPPIALALAGVISWT